MTSKPSVLEDSKRLARASIRQTRNRRGQFAGRYDFHSRYRAAATVLRFAWPADPESVSTRNFDDARSAAGHSDLPRADQLARSVGLSWSEFKCVALDTTRDQMRTYGARRKQPARRAIFTSQSAAAIVRRVASALGQATPTAVDYDIYRIDYLARNRDVRFLFPTSDQVIAACGGWLAALLLADLDAPELDRKGVGMPVRDALGLFLSTQGRLPGKHQLKAFAADERWSFRLGQLGVGTWDAQVLAFRAYWTGTLGRWAPSRPTTGCEFLPLSAIEIARLPLRTGPPRGWWTYERVLACISRYFDDTGASVLKQAPYRAWAKAQNAAGIWTAPPSRFVRYGTLAELAIAAREHSGCR